MLVAPNAYASIGEVMLLQNKEYIAWHCMTKRAWCSFVPDSILTNAQHSSPDSGDGLGSMCHWEPDERLRVMYTGLAGLDMPHKPLSRVKNVSSHAVPFDSPCAVQRCFHRFFNILDHHLRICHDQCD